MSAVPGMPDPKMRSRGPGALDKTYPLDEGESFGLEFTDHGWAEIVEPYVIGPVVQVPTLLMQSLMRHGRSEQLPRAATVDLEKGLAPGKIHMISRIRQVTSRPPKSWLRACVRLAFPDDPTFGYEDWLDFPTDLLGRVIEQSQRTDKALTAVENVPAGYSGRVRVPVQPRWAGSHAFDPVFRRACEVTQAEKIEAGQKKLKARTVMATTEATMLADAHVLCIPPEQVAVLPEWESPQEVFDYADELVLPFDPLFLDFTGPGGVTATVAEWIDGKPMALGGALVWRQQGMGGESLLVAPYGWPTTADREWMDGTELTQWESPGWFSLGALPIDRATGEIVAAGDVQLFVGNTEMHALSATVYADACADVDYGASLPGYAMLPFDKTGLKREAVDNDEAARVLFAWGSMIWTLASRVLAALSITEAVEVEFVDAPMERRDYKRAVKRRWPIAQQVVIRSHSKRYLDSNPPSGNEANYSHRFWRRAHVAHYPLGTRMADTRPDLVTPCRREPERNCGFCRKVKRPATIVGPEDKPLVLKTLRRGT